MKQRVRLVPAALAVPPLGAADQPVGDCPSELRLLRTSNRPEKVFPWQLIVRGGLPAAGSTKLVRITMGIQDMGAKVWYRDSGILPPVAITHLQEALTQFSKSLSLLLAMY